MSQRDRRSSPDISFTATVQAQQMRWDEVPDVHVTFTGSPGFESVSESDRINLPDSVRAGETYRNVRVDYRLECTLPDQLDDARPDA
ncbi:hypothetical protein ACQP04_29090 [Pseudonocardia halophobica]|uniref:hypothetical protein n=1 Tax=Pseudonocardia halophobica TaxID=29401 RepID=UPI003D933E18